MSTEWHLAEEDLLSYAEVRCGPPLRWSVEAHLAACAACRARLGDLVADSLVAPGWVALDAELDSVVPGRLERALVALGVREHAARLLVATPVLRASWLLSLGATLTLVTLLAHIGTTVSAPELMLVIAPLLPVAGVVASFGPRVDPTHDLALVAPMSTFRLLLLRTIAVLGVTTGLSLVACVALPDLGLATLAWLLPALVLTSVTLALTARLGPVLAAGSVVLAWSGVLFLAFEPSVVDIELLSPAAQAVIVLVGAVSVLAIRMWRPYYETDTHPYGRKSA